MIELIKNVEVITVEEGDMQEIEIDGVRYTKKDKTFGQVISEHENDKSVELEKVSFYDTKGKLVVEMHGRESFINKNDAIKLFSDNSCKTGKIIGGYLEVMGELTVEYEKNKAFNLLSTSQDNNVLIGLYDESNRGIGKTSELIKLAHKEEAVMVIGSLQRERLTRAYADSLGLNIVIRAMSDELETRGVRLKNNKFIVDEDVSFEVIKGLINGGNKLIGGFINLHEAFHK